MTEQTSRMSSTARNQSAPEDSFRATFLHAPVGIAHVGPDGQWLDVNPRLCAILGYTREELFSRTFQQITHPDDLDEDTQYVSELLAGHGDSYAMEKRYLRKDGSLIWARLTVSLLRHPDGSPHHFISVVEDIDAQKRTEEDNARLYQQAQEAIREREALLSVASHELKNPLTVLLGYAHMLVLHHTSGRATPERTERGLQQILEQGERLNQLLDTLLDVARLDSGRLLIERVPVEVTALLQRIIEGLQPTLERHAIVLDTPDEPSIVLGDATRLEQVFRNLLSNAVTYSPAGGTVAVVVEPRGGDLCVAVRDQGIGIAESDLPALFGRFYRTENARRANARGLGIGLHVVREIVVLHGGTVSVNSRLGHGSEFTVCLPLA
ncbi:MAG: hypothetical protein RLZZ387_4041 [Chloroflexota bacterium]|jgi:PAS domain S-box-containing protein